jgi:Ca2+-binding EF-hand superfamily protein
MTTGAKQVCFFREFLIRKYGNLIRGWVNLLDKDKSGAVSRKEFVQALLEVHFPGDAGGLWRRLDKDHSGTITLSELAPKSADEVADFKHWAKKTFGSMKEAFICMDADRNGVLSMEEFCMAAKKFGFTNNRLKLIFQCLDVNGRGTVKADEVRWLDKWDPPQYLYFDADKEAWVKFKDQLIARCRGNPITAWRKFLDRDSSMRVNWMEFYNACRRLKTTYTIPAMWRSVDENLSGWVSIKEFDDSAFNMLGGFKLWVKGRYRTMSRFMDAVDESKSGDLSWKEFQRAITSAINIDVTRLQMLFEGLDMDGQRRIALDELAFLEDWKIELDMEEEQVFPHFGVQSDDQSESGSEAPRARAEDADTGSSPSPPRRNSRQIRTGTAGKELNALIK